MRGWFAVLVAAALTGLTGCACFPLLDDTTSTDLSQNPLEQRLGPPLQRFSADGRIALRQGERRDHLRFRWDHAPDRDVVLLMSPLGQGMAQLERDAAGARLIQPGQPPRTAPDLRQLAQQIFGTPLPLDQLAGVMAADGGWVTGQSQDIEGWRVRVSESLLHPATLADGSAQRRLLRALEVSRDEVELKMIVDEWDSLDD